MTTIDAAWLSFDESKKGSIEVGKFGDLAILTGDCLAVPDDRINDIRSLVTIAGGRVLYEAPRRVPTAEPGGIRRPLDTATLQRYGSRNRLTERVLHSRTTTARQRHRMSSNRRTIVLLAVVVVLACVSAAPSAQNDADLILHAGKVVTVDAGFTITEAIAVKDGRIVAVGPSAEIIESRRGPATQMIDLQGRTVLPGLTDAHTHPLGAALSELTMPFAVLRSFDEVRAYIREQASKTPKGQWIQVPKTFPARLKEMQMPTREVLDAALEHPVFYDASYASAVNSYALRISRINKEAPDPKDKGARIVRDQNGEPTGILTGGATALLKDRPRERSFTEQEKLDALEQMLKRYLAAGLTSIGDRGVSAEAYGLYATLKAAGKLPLRITMTGRLRLQEIPKSDWVTGRGDEWLKFGSFKVGLDGGMNAGTAKMLEPYGPYSGQLFGLSDPDNDGDLRMTPQELMTIMRTAYDKGWQLSAHAQGSGAVDTLATVFETLNNEKPIAPTRPHFIHASFLTPQLIERAKTIGAIFDVQPDWLHFDGLALSKVTSAEAMRYFVPLKSLADAGVVFAGGSDHMIGWDKNNAINAYNPFLSMWIAITRQTAQGVVIHAEQRITREQALRMHTSWAAYLQHAEKDRGSIEPGKLADFVVIDRDYLTVPEDEIREIEPVMTLLEGRVAYTRSTENKSPRGAYSDLNGGKRGRLPHGEGDADLLGARTRTCSKGGSQ